MVKESLRPTGMHSPRTPQGRAGGPFGAGMGEFEWNRVTDRILVSERLAAMTGVPAGSMRAQGGRVALDYIYPDDISVLQSQVEPLIREGDRCDLRFRLIRPELGDLMWVSLSAVLIRGEGGQVEKVIGAVRDISGRKADEEERNALLLELDHRVKNVLDSIQSLAEQSARRSRSAEALMKAISARLEAMTAAHTLLTAMRRRGADIGHIAAAELAGLAFGRAEWSGPAVILTAHATNTLALALHELATNAVKFGALSIDAGRVDITWRSTAEGGFELAWTETKGPPVAPPTHRGFGRDFLEVTACQELGGNVSLEFKPEGLRAVIVGGPQTVTEAADESAAEVELEALADAALPPPLLGAADGMGARDVRGGRAGVSRLKILVVEDSNLLTLELKRGIKALGGRVIGSAARVEDAQRFLNVDFDAAVLDLDLNGQSVLPLAEALTERDIPFVFTAASDEGAPAPRGFSAQIVRKPYTLDQIAAAIHRARTG